MSCGHDDNFNKKMQNMAKNKNSIIIMAENNRKKLNESQVIRSSMNNSLNKDYR